MRQHLAVGERLLLGAGAVLAHAHAHDGERFGAGEHVGVAGAGVVGVGVGDDGAVHRAHRVDVEAAGLAEQAVGEDFQPGVGVRHVPGL